MNSFKDYLVQKYNRDAELVLKYEKEIDEITVKAHEETRDLSWRKRIEKIRPYQIQVENLTIKLLKNLKAKFSKKQANGFTQMEFSKIMARKKDILIVFIGPFYDFMQKIKSNIKFKKTK